MSQNRIFGTTKVPVPCVSTVAACRGEVVETQPLSSATDGRDSGGEVGVKDRQTCLGKETYDAMYVGKRAAFLALMTITFVAFDQAYQGTKYSFTNALDHYYRLHHAVQASNENSL